MKKKIRFSMQSRPAVIDGIKAQRVLPNKFARAVGPFVLLDHISSCKQSPDDSHIEDNRKYAHPHRGVITLTYIINGEVEHVDSIGNHVKLSAGGVHWMKAGKGVVHDEVINTGCKTNGSDISVIQFWVNLPSKHKCEDPDYLSFYAPDILIQLLNSDAGWIKILMGTYGNAIANIPTCSRQFLYHIHVEAGKHFFAVPESGLECAVFLLTSKVVVNDEGFEAGAFIVFGSEGELIEIDNGGKTATDIILFGGEPYSEAIVSDGFFVMNTPHDVTQAYNDYYDGKYGDI